MRISQQNPIFIGETGEIQRHLAERGGFEPPVQCYPYNGLANRRFRPLSHLSVIVNLRMDGA